MPRTRNPYPADVREQIVAPVAIMKGRTAISLIGRIVLVAAALIAWDPYGAHQTRKTAAAAAEDCDLCTRRHQSLTRIKKATEQDRENLLSETVWFSYKVVDESVLLTGQLYRPETDEPAPAVVLMHGCAGPWSLQTEWAERFQSWGYVALVLDSFGPRGFDAICQELHSGAPHRGSRLARGFDAYGAHSFLSALDFVDPQRIGLIGWSHGAQVAQAIATGTAVNISLMGSRARQFQAVVALYPWCAAVGKIRIPLLILIGDGDDWTPAPRCQSFAAGEQLIGSPVEIVVYPNATHSFDGTDIGDGLVELGHFLRHDAAATRDAVDRVKAFFARHLSG